MYELIAQSLGVVGMIVGLLAYQCKSSKGILMTKFAANILWTIHYLMIGAITAFATAIVCDIREFVYANEKNDKKRLVWLGIFMVLCVVSMVITWQGAVSLLPGIATMLSTYGFYQKEAKNIRYVSIVFVVMMLVYDVIVMSYAGIVNQIITLFSIFIAIYRYRNVGEEACEK